MFFKVWSAEGRIRISFCFDSEYPVVGLGICQFNKAVRT
jgi:hypothetical protein